MKIEKLKIEKEEDEDIQPSIFNFQFSIYGETLKIEKLKIEEAEED